MKDKEIRALFDAVDINKDGRIDFGELVDFICPSAKPENAAARRRLKEAFAAARPGPGSYDTAAARKQKVRGGGFGKAPR
mmetsp:Transcript_114091/g.354237  ORF Transcript_114091/g.354237 Transcript_114091/m.354237 type:complete len:80 (-) Transcript_114091:47-286(-)